MLVDQKQQQGFSLIELLLVLVVMVSILLAGYHRYQQYIIKKDLAIVRQNVAMLFNSLDAYYAQLVSNAKPLPCTQGVISVSKAELLQQSLWPQLLSSNLAAVTDYGVSSNQTPIEIKELTSNEACHYTHQLIVTVYLDPSITNLSWYASMLEAKVENGKLQWTKMPGYTYTRSGMGSDLWIMGGELAVFKKALTTTAS